MSRTAGGDLGNCQMGCGEPAEGRLDLRILGPTAFCRPCAERLVAGLMRHRGPGPESYSKFHQAGIIDTWNAWLSKRYQNGQLPVGGEKDLDDFQNDYTVGNRAISQLRKYLYGSRKEAWMGWGPIVAERQHSVDGWEWDKRLSAYIATDIPDTFTCKCGSKLKVPSYTNCKCGKIWNSYVIGTGGENRQAAVEKFLCREVPVRDNVIVANRKLAAEGVPVSLSNNGGETWNVHKPGCSALNGRRKQRDIGGHEEAREFPDHKSVVMDVFPPHQFDYDPDHPKWGWKYYKKYVKLHDCIKGQIPEDASKTASVRIAKGKCECWEGYERVPGTKPCAEGSCRKCDGHRKAMRNAATDYKTHTRDQGRAEHKQHDLEDRDGEVPTPSWAQRDRRDDVDEYAPEPICAENSGCPECDERRQIPRPRQARRRTASSSARYVLLPHWDTEEAHRILMQHAREMGFHTALQVTPELMDEARGGGFTLHDHVGDGPTSGYMVSMDKNTEDSRPMDELTPEVVQGFADKHANALAQSGNYLGGWLDGGRFYLDISSHIPDLNRATNSAVRNKQLGIYDLNHGRTLDTDEAGWMTGAPGVVGKKQRGTSYSPQGRPAKGRQRAARSRRTTTAGKENCPSCGKGLRSYDLSGVTDHRGQRGCHNHVPAGIKAQMRHAAEEDFATDEWPSEHHPDTGNKLKSTADDWHRRDKNQRWTGKA
jgi:hypothetical protein